MVRGCSAYSFDPSSFNFSASDCVSPSGLDDSTVRTLRIPLHPVTARTRAVPIQSRLLATEVCLRVCQPFFVQVNKRLDANTAQDGFAGIGLTHCFQC